MESSERPAAPRARWTSLWIVAAVSFVAQLALCQFFSLGLNVPFSEDINPSKLWTLAYHFPPAGTFQVLNWFGVPYLPQPLNPLSLAAAILSPWFFFTSYVPVMSTLALLAMAAFLREMEISRPASLFSAVIYAWQGDILSFIYPGHYGYLTSWPFFALAAWGALRAQRTGRWPYAIISGACCGIMVGLLTNYDRGGIASMLIGALYLAPLLRNRTSLHPLFHFFLCTVTAAVIALAPLLALAKSYIIGVNLGGASDREQTYKLVTQYSLGPAETLTYLVPGFFGWHINDRDGMYWGWIGEWPGWNPQHPDGPANSNLAISTCGTIATLLAGIGAIVVLPGTGRSSPRQRFYARFLLALGLVTLVLSWGWHTGPLYRALFQLPLMDKWRNPLKWLEMFNFALMPLGAIGLDYVLGSLDPKNADAARIRKRLGWYATLAVSLLTAGFLISYPLVPIFDRVLVNEGLEPPVVAGMAETMQHAMLWAIVLAALLGLVPLALWRVEKWRGWTLPNPWLQRLWEKILRPEHLPLTLSLSLAFLSACQLGHVANAFIEPVPLPLLTSSNPLLDALQQEGNRVRVSVEVGDWELNTLLQNQFAAMGISCLDISAASRYPVDLTQVFDALKDNHARLWFLAGVKNVVVPEAGLTQLRQQPEVASNIAQVEGFTIEQTPSPDVPSHAMLVLKDYLAKATLVPGDEVLPKAEALKRLVDPKWNPRETVLLSIAGKDDPLKEGCLTAKEPVTFPQAPGASAAIDHLDLKTYTTTEIDLDVQSTRNAFVLINDQFDPDWEVQVNGRDATLLRGDYILRAIAVPAGTSTITMHYVSHYLRVPATPMNIFSDAAMVLAWAVAGIALYRKN